MCGFRYVGCFVNTADIHNTHNQTMNTCTRNRRSEVIRNCLHPKCELPHLMSVPCHRLVGVYVGHQLYTLDTWMRAQHMRSIWPEGTKTLRQYTAHTHTQHIGAHRMLSYSVLVCNAHKVHNYVEATCRIIYDVHFDVVEPSIDCITSQWVEHVKQWTRFRISFVISELSG